VAQLAVEEALVWEQPLEAAVVAWAWEKTEAQGLGRRLRPAHSLAE